MPYYQFKSIIGDLYFDKNLNAVRRPKQKKAHILAPGVAKQQEILHSLKDKKNYSDFVAANIKQSIKDISQSLSADTFVIQCSGSVEDLQRMVNIVHARIHEWVGYVAPELVKKIGDTGRLIGLLSNQSLKQVLKKEHVEVLMGVSQSAVSERALKELIINAQLVEQTLSYEKKQLDSLAEEVIPNVTAVCGSSLGAKLLSRSGSLERMAKMPASTIQLLGAEAALFRHLKSRARPPKHGIIHEHPLIAKVEKKDRGKVARDLGNKISMASKIDFFKGTFIGNKLRKDLEKRFVKW